MLGFERQIAVKMRVALWLATLLPAGVAAAQESDSALPKIEPLASVSGAVDFDISGADSQTAKDTAGATLFAKVPRDLSSEISAESEERPAPGRAIERAQQKVRALQAEGGAYADGLADALSELGMAYRDADQRKGAVTAFKEALHVARVNHGLHDLRQIPYLEHLIEENAALGRWEKVIENYHYLYWIHKRNYGDKDPRLLPVIERVALAELAIHKSTPMKPVSSDLEKNQRLLQKAVEIIELHYGNDLQRMADALYRVALSNYGIALQTGKLLHYRKYRRARRGGTVFVDEDLGKAFQLIQRTERDGRSALHRIEELYEDRAPSKTLQRALVLVRQGDWRQLYGNGSGRRDYREAYELLVQLEDGEKHITRIFGEPHLLPAMDAWDKDEQTEETPATPSEAQGDVVELAFDVRATGEAHNVDARSVPEGLKEEAEKLQRYIQLLRFRPRMENGDPVTARMERQFLITDEGRIVQLDSDSERLETAETEY